MPPKKKQPPKTPSIVPTSSSESSPEGTAPARSSAPATGTTQEESEPQPSTSAGLASDSGTPAAGTSSQEEWQTAGKKQKVSKKLFAPAATPKKKAPAKTKTTKDLEDQELHKEGKYLHQQWGEKPDSTHKYKPTSQLNTTREDIRVKKGALRIPVGMFELLFHLTLEREKRIPRGLRDKAESLPGCWTPAWTRTIMEYNPTDEASLEEQLKERLRRCFPTIQFGKKTDIAFTWVNSLEVEDRSTREIERSLQYFPCVGVEFIPFSEDVKEEAKANKIKIPPIRFWIIVTGAPRVYVFDTLSIQKYQQRLPSGFATLLKRGENQPNTTKYAILGPNMIEASEFPLEFKSCRTDTMLTWLFRGAPAGESKPPSFDLGGYSSWKWGFDFRPGKITEERLRRPNGTFEIHPDTYGHLEIKGSKERHQAECIKTESLLDFDIEWRNIGFILGYLNSVGVTMMAIVYECALANGGNKAFPTAIRKVCELTCNRTPEDIIAQYGSDAEFPSGFDEEEYASVYSAPTSAKTSQTSRGKPKDFAEALAEGDIPKNPPPPKFYEVVREKEIIKADGQKETVKVKETILQSQYTDVAQGTASAASGTPDLVEITASETEFPQIGTRTSRLQSLGTVPKPQGSRLQETTETSETPAEDLPSGETEQEVGEGDVPMQSPAHETSQLNVVDDNFLASLGNMLVTPEAEKPAPMDQGLTIQIPEPGTPFSTGAPGSQAQVTPTPSGTGTGAFDPSTETGTFMEQKSPPQMTPNLPTLPPFSPAYKPSIAEVITEDDGTVRFVYRGYINGVDNYTRLNVLRPVTMSTSEFAAKLGAGLELYFKGISDQVYKQQLIREWKTYLRDGIVAEIWDHVDLKLRAHGGMMLLPDELYKFVDPLRQAARERVTESSGVSMEEFVKNLPDDDVEEIAANIFTVLGSYYATCTTWERTQVEFEMLLLMVEKRVLEIAEIEKTVAAERSTSAAKLLPNIIFNDDLGYDLTDIKNPRVTKHGAQVDLKTGQEVHKESDRQAPLQEPPPREIPEVDLTSTAGATVTDESQQQSQNLLNLNVDPADLELFQEGDVEMGDQFDDASEGEEEEESKEETPLPSLDPEEPMQTDQPETVTSPPPPPAPTPVNVTTESGSQDSASSNFVRNIKGTEYVECHYNGHEYKCHVPDPDNSCFSITNNGMANRTAVRAKLRTSGEPCTLTAVQRGKIMAKLACKVPLNFEEEYYGFVNKLHGELPAQQPNESAAAYGVRRYNWLLDFYQLTSSLQLRSSLRKAQEEGELLEGIEVYLLDHPASRSAHIAKAVDNNLRDRKLRKSTPATTSSGGEASLQKEKVPRETPLETQTRQEVELLKQKLTELAQAQLDAEKRAAESRAEDLARIKKAEEGERRARAEAARERAEADRAKTLAAAQALGESVNLAEIQRASAQAAKVSASEREKANLESARLMRIGTLEDDLDQIRTKAQIPPEIRRRLLDKDRAGNFLKGHLPDYVTSNFANDDEDTAENWRNLKGYYKTVNEKLPATGMEEVLKAYAAGQNIVNMKKRYWLMLFFQEHEKQLLAAIQKAQQDLGDYFMPAGKRPTTRPKVTDTLKELVKDVTGAPISQRAGVVPHHPQVESRPVLPSRDCVPNLSVFKVQKKGNEVTKVTHTLAQEITESVATLFGSEPTPQQEESGVFVSYSSPEEDVAAAALGVCHRVTDLMPDCQVPPTVVPRDPESDTPSVEEYLESYSPLNNPTSRGVILDKVYCLHCGSTRGENCECDKYHCVYPPCQDPLKHSTALCPLLMSRCERCLLRGHTADLCHRYTFFQWEEIYPRFQLLNVYTRKVRHNMSLMVYPFPSTISGILIRAMSLILGRMSFYPLAARQGFRWVEERFEEALTFCEGQSAVAHLVPQARADIRLRPYLRLTLRDR